VIPSKYQPAKRALARLRYVSGLLDERPGEVTEIAVAPSMATHDRDRGHWGRKVPYFTVPWATEQGRFEKD
jgi:hypothetical protein